MKIGWAKGMHFARLVACHGAAKNVRWGKFMPHPPTLRSWMSVLLLPLGLACCVLTSYAADPLRVLLVTGGHDYETNAFHQMFAENPAIQVEHVAHPAPLTPLRPTHQPPVDVVVLYDLWQDITEESKSDLLAHLRAGRGLVSLHHSIANYQDSPDYRKIIGARYYLQKMTVDGVEKARSVYLHDVHMKVTLATPDHPVTRGLQDFEIVDETYNLFDVADGVVPLLRTSAASSAPLIGWAKNHGPARVVYLQLGHGSTSYTNPSYRKLVAQAIRWTAPQP